MDPAPTRCSSKPYCYCSLQDICSALKQLSMRAAAQATNPSNKDGATRIRQWCDARENDLGQMMHSLGPDPEAARLLSDWLAHAPAPMVAPEDSGDPYAALCRDVAVLEDHLMLLFSTLMQQGDSAWARRLYCGLLDHRAPVSFVPRAMLRETPRLCPPLN